MKLHLWSLRFNILKWWLRAWGPNSCQIPFWRKTSLVKRSVLNKHETKIKNACSHLDKRHSLESCGFASRSRLIVTIQIASICIFVILAWLQQSYVRMFARQTKYTNNWTNFSHALIDSRVLSVPWWLNWIVNIIITIIVIIITITIILYYCYRDCYCHYYGYEWLVLSPLV